MLNGLRKERQEPEPPSLLEIACGGRLMLVQTPANIILKDGRVFWVTDLQAWGYTPFGILGVGSFEPDASEDEWESRLFAADTVAEIYFNKERYEAIIEEIQVEQNDPTTNDGEDSESNVDPIPDPVAEAA